MPFCGHSEEQVECELCREMVWESDTDLIEGMESDGQGVYRYQIVSCLSCINKNERAEAEGQMLMDE